MTDVADAAIEDAVHQALAHHAAAQPTNQLIARFWVPAPDPGSEAGKRVRLQHLTETSRIQSSRQQVSHGAVSDLSSELQKYAAQHSDTILAHHPGSSQSQHKPSFISTAGAKEVLQTYFKDHKLLQQSIMAPDHLLLQLSACNNDQILISDIEDLVSMALDRADAWAVLDAVATDRSGSLDYQKVHNFVHMLAERRGYMPEGKLGEHWKIVAPRKIFFLLSNSSHKVPARALVAHSLLDEMLAYDASSEYPSQKLDWFAPEKTAAIVGRFEELCAENPSKLLFPEQLMQVRTAQHMDDGHVVSSMAPFFAQRVFEMHVHSVCPVTGRPGMNLAEFADFLLAWNFRGELPSTKYFFRVLDVENTGRLSATVVHMWCRLVHEVAVHKMACLYPYNPEDVKDEIFDMVKPQHTSGLSLTDIMNSQMSDTICAILVDGQCHHDYDQREALQQQQQEEGY